MAGRHQRRRQRPHDDLECSRFAGDSEVFSCFHWLLSLLYRSMEVAQRGGHDGGSKVFQGARPLQHGRWIGRSSAFIAQSRRPSVDAYTFGKEEPGFWRRMGLATGKGIDGGKGKGQTFLRKNGRSTASLSSFQIFPHTSSICTVTRRYINIARIWQNMLC